MVWLCRRCANAYEKDGKLPDVEVAVVPAHHALRGRKEKHMSLELHDRFDGDARLGTFNSRTGLLVLDWRRPLRCTD